MICPHCGERSEPRYLMEADPDAPGFLALLRGEGEPVLRAVAWLAVWIVVFACACGLWSALVSA